MSVDNYTIVHGDNFIRVTKEQFEEFNANTDIKEFINKYNLVEVPTPTSTAPIKELKLAADATERALTRNVILISERKLTSGTIYYQ